MFWVRSFLCVLAHIIRRLYFAVGQGQVVEAVSARACAHANFSERSVPKHASMYGRCFYCISATFGEIDF